MARFRVLALGAALALTTVSTGALGAGPNVGIAHPVGTLLTPLE